MSQEQELRTASISSIQREEEERRPLSSQSACIAAKGTIVISSNQRVLYSVFEHPSDFHPFLQWIQRKTGCAPLRILFHQDPSPIFFRSGLSLTVIKELLILNKKTGGPFCSRTESLCCRCR